MRFCFAFYSFLDFSIASTQHVAGSASIHLAANQGTCCSSHGNAYPAPISSGKSSTCTCAKQAADDAAFDAAVGIHVALLRGRRWRCGGARGWRSAGDFHFLRPVAHVSRLGFGAWDVFLPILVAEALGACRIARLVSRFSEASRGQEPGTRQGEEHGDEALHESIGLSVARACSGSRV